MRGETDNFGFSVAAHYHGHFIAGAPGQAVPDPSGSGTLVGAGNVGRFLWSR